MTRRVIRIALAVLIAGMGAAPARAFNDAGASTFESGERLYRPQVPRLEDIPVPHVEVEPAAGAAAGAKKKASGPAFEIQRFEVRGNTLLLPSQIDAVLGAFLGNGKHIEDVQGARNALEKLYAKEGFVTVAVSIPQQTVEAGTIRLQVIEARLGKVSIQNPGIHWYGDKTVTEATPHLKTGAVLRRSDVEEDLRRANREADMQVQPVLKPGKEPGTVDLVLQVHDRIPLHGAVEFDNDRPPGSPRRRSQAQLSYANLWGLGHEISAFYRTDVTSRPQDVKIYGATYRAPMPWSDGQSLFGYVVKSDTTNEIVTAPGVSLLGQGLNMGLRYQATLPEIAGLPWYHHSVTLGIDRKDVKNSLVQGPIQIVTPIKYWPLSLAYDIGLDFPHSQTTFQAALHLNRAGFLGGAQTEDFQNNRGGISADNPVDGNYEVLLMHLDELIRAPALLRTLAAGRFVSLPPPESPGFADDWTVHLMARGQWASQPLVPTEEYAAGGVDTVRGYLQSERFGDDAWNIQLELRTPYWSPRLLGGMLSERFQLLAFFDAARLYTLNHGEGQQAFSDLEGVGFGLHASLFDHVTAKLYATHPLLQTEFTSDPVRFNFQVSAGF